MKPEMTEMTPCKNEARTDREVQLSIAEDLLDVTSCFGLL